VGGQRGGPAAGDGKDIIQELIAPLDNPRVDFHIHTVASDGRWSPEQLVAQVQRMGIDCFAVTDHDTVGSVAQTEKLARQQGLGFLRGVEISAKLDGRLIHILAYGFELGNEPFCQFLQANKAQLESYNDGLLQKLIDAGYDLDFDEYLEYAWDRHRGGWKSLNFVVDKGFCQDVHGFFNELFVGDLKVTFPDFASPAEVVRIIMGAGGIPVWAHPANSLSKQEQASPDDDESVVAQMVDAGIQGLECYACHHDAGWTNRCLAWAARYNLLITGGSDSHGGFASRQLGQPMIHLDDLRLGPIAERVIR
jgi:hypothetical protein